MGILLFIISIILSAIFLPLGFFWTLFSTLGRAKVDVFWKRINSYFFVMAVSIDQFCNVAMQDMFNLIMIKRGGYKFGHEDETLSSVYGKNSAKGTLTALGKGIAWMLNFLDPGHVTKAIESDENNNLK